MYILWNSAAEFILLFIKKKDFFVFFVCYFGSKTHLFIIKREKRFSGSSGVNLKME